MNNKIPNVLFQLAKESTCPIYLVGGYVRNYFLNLRVSSDYDICGQLPANQLNLGPNYKLIPVNKKLGTTVIIINDTKFEYTPFRLESYKDGGAHTPIEVTLGCSIREDALRRDFTCNAIYYDILSNNFIDFFGGIDDIKNAILRAYNPNQVFKRDGLRLLRAIRLASELGFDLDKETEIAIKNYFSLLRDISPERKREELDKILLADQKYGKTDAHYRGIEMLANCRLWKYLIPEVEMLRGVKQNPKYHIYDVMEHVFQTVKFSSPKIRLAALLHDIAKPHCIDEMGHMKGHEILGEIMARKILGQSGLKYPNKIINEVCSLVRYHMYDLKNEASIAKLRTFASDHFDILDKLVDLKQADSMARGFKDVVPNNRLSLVAKIIKNDNTPISLNQLKINGRDLLELNIKNSLIGQILKQLRYECILDPKLNNRDWLLKRAFKIYLNSI